MGRVWTWDMALDPGKEPDRIMSVDLGHSLLLQISWQHRGDPPSSVSVFRGAECFASVGGKDGRFPSNLSMVPQEGPDKGLSLTDSDFDGVFDLKVDMERPQGHAFIRNKTTGNWELIHTGDGEDSK